MDTIERSDIEYLDKSLNNDNIDIYPAKQVLPNQIKNSNANYFKNWLNYLVRVSLQTAFYDDLVNFDDAIKEVGSKIQVCK